jgi:predicted Zn-dependent protease
MGRTSRGIQRAHLFWLIYPAVLLFSIAAAVVGHSQDSEQVALATEAPDTLYPHQPVRLDPPPPTPEELGDALMLHQRYQAAIESYSKATPSSDIWDKMGIAYEMMFASSAAERCYKESLKLNPRNAHTLNNYGSLYFSLRQFGDAEHKYRKALGIEPGSAAVQLNLGTDLIAEHKFEEGWEHYRYALEIDSHAFENTMSPRIGNPVLAQDRGAVNYYLARGFARVGLMKTAIDHLRAALELGFTNSKKIEADQSFASLRELPAYQDLLSQTHRP